MIEYFFPHGLNDWYDYSLALIIFFSLIALIRGAASWMKDNIFKW